MIKILSTAAALTWSLCTQAATLTIDDFMIAQAQLSDGTVTGVVASETGYLTSPILGGYREIMIDQRSNMGKGEMSYIAVANGQLTMGNDAGASSTGTVRWDGPGPFTGIGAAINPTGFGGLALANVLTDSFTLRVQYASDPFSFRLDAYTDAVNWSTVQLALPATQVPATFVIPLVTFLDCTNSGFPGPPAVVVTCGSGFGVNFDNVGALQAVIELAGSVSAPVPGSQAAELAMTPSPSLLVLALTPAAAVPEPGSAALLLGGLGLAGVWGALGARQGGRRRRPSLAIGEPMALGCQIAAGFKRPSPRASSTAACRQGVNMPKTLAALALAALAWANSAQAFNVFLTTDLFTTSQFRIVDTTVGGGATVSEVGNPIDITILGGFRELMIDQTANLGGGEQSYIEVVMGAVRMGNQAGAASTGTLRWDGRSQFPGGAINVTGLGFGGPGLDFGNVFADHFGMTVVSASAAFDIRIEAYTNALHWSKLQVKLAASPTPFAFNTPLSDFLPCASPPVGNLTCGPGGPVDFNNLGALQIVLDLSGALDTAASASNQASQLLIPQPSTLVLARGQVSVVPEPASAALLLVGMGVLAGLGRRQTAHRRFSAWHAYLRSV